jgi:PIN domain nuclease of toxin-antitoxin system
MIPVVVLDASALLAVALHERGRDVVLAHVKTSDKRFRQAKTTAAISFFRE